MKEKEGREKKTLEALEMDGSESENIVFRNVSRLYEDVGPGIKST